MKCSGARRMRELSKYTKLPVPTLTAPTDTRVSPELIRSKSHSFSSVARSCDVSYQLIFSG